MDCPKDQWGIKHIDIEFVQAYIPNLVLGESKTLSELKIENNPDASKEDQKAEWEK